MFQNSAGESDLRLVPGLRRLIPSSVRSPLDGLLALALLFASFWARRGTLPYDGLWFDDSWVANGAIFGHPNQLLTVGSGHPGFTAGLMAMDRLGFGSPHNMGIPSLIAGVLAPAALYLAVRLTRLSRSIALLIAAPLVVAPIAVMYSGRVKAYTLDTLAVLLLVALVPWAARRKWGWRTSLAWAAAMILLGTFSGYILFATAAATLTLFLHPSSDRGRRFAAGLLQLVVQGGLALAAGSRTNLADVERVMQTSYDAHMDLYLDPRSLAHEVAQHLRRIAEVYPSGPGRWLSIVVVAALAGLALGAFRARNRTEALAARYLLIAFTLAAVGSFADRFPFGPDNRGIAVGSPGGRHALWMVPVFAFGLAIIADRVRDLLAHTPVGKVAFDVAFVAAAMVLVVRCYRPAPEAPYQGSTSAAHFVDTHRGPNDLLLLSSGSLFNYANATTTPLHLTWTPTHQVGWAPEFEDRQVIAMGAFAATPSTQATIRAAIDAHRRVFILSHGALQNERNSAAQILQSEGFTKVSEHDFGWNSVDEWVRPASSP